MLIRNNKKRRRLSFEILIIVAICFVLSLILYGLITHLAPRLVEEYCFNYDIVLDGYELYSLDVTMFGAGVAISVVFFIILFFTIFGERLAYIRKITAGIDALRMGNYGYQVQLAWNNELTDLAEAVNYLSESEQRIKAKEKRLNEEKEELIRTLSHDIRTPLTSIISYTELLSSKKSLTADEQQEYLSVVSKKTAMIKELTDILLDSGKRNPELFEDARLLFEQLSEEFSEELEESFMLSVNPSPLQAFSGRFDTGEMRRIFDNLISNIQKYADPTKIVKLSVIKEDSGIIIRQSNAIRNNGSEQESYKMGLNSIRRIAQNYGGTVEIHETKEDFEILITLSNI